MLILTLHAYSLVRAAALMAVEFFLAIIDCFRGIISGANLVKEIKFIPSRVGISILMREMATIGAILDVARGLPIIHLDFIGYDEQSHRRGPELAVCPLVAQGNRRCHSTPLESGPSLAEAGL